MRNYEFKLTPAYCLYNGIAIKRQQGSRICFLSEDPDDKQLRSRVTKAFKNYLEGMDKTPKPHVILFLHLPLSPLSSRNKNYLA